MYVLIFLSKKEENCQQALATNMIHNANSLIHSRSAGIQKVQGKQKGTDEAKAWKVKLINTKR